MKALFLLLTVLGVIAVKFVTGKISSDTSIVVSNKQQPAIAGKIAFRRSGCDSSEFQCSNGKCILDSWQCDNYDDCGDESDERNCGSGNTVSCGGHSANTCAGCPQGWPGKKWCHGDCTWRRGRCVSKGGGSGSGSNSGGGSGSGSPSGFARRQLDKHNNYRYHHGARDLAYSKSLENAAQRHANYLARLNDGLEHSNSNNGENIAVYYDSNSSPSAEGTTKSWYDEESNYNYQTGSSNGGKIGHFTQIVWKGTTKLGIAKASATRKKNGFYATYVVAQYSPAGNVIGRSNYRANVHKWTNGRQRTGK